MPLRILINGAGVAGPALATMLLSSSSPSYQITIVERAPDLRTGGQQIDLRAQAIPILKRFGLLETIKKHCVGENGIAFLDSHGNVQATMGKNETGQGPQSFTSDYEIIRGDLVRVLHDASLEAASNASPATDSALRYEFGKHATDLSQRGDAVDVTFSDGTTRTFDLVVGADGQGSRTRRALLGREASDASFRSVGVHMAFYRAPRDPAEPDVMTAKVCHAPGRRLMATRTGNQSFTQVILASGCPGERLEAAGLRGDVEEQKAAVAELFRGAGWKAERFLEDMKTTEDFYFQHIGQVRLEKWHKGRVVLLGDAGYCPSPVTGMGTTSAIVGCYVLAGELAARRSGDGFDVDAALDGYEKTLRPFVTETQYLPWAQTRLMFYDTAWGIWVAHKIAAFITGFGIDQLVMKFLPEEKANWKIPGYPELKGELPVTA